MYRSGIISMNPQITCLLTCVQQYCVTLPTKQPALAEAKKTNKKTGKPTDQWNLTFCCCLSVWKLLCARARLRNGRYARTRVSAYQTWVLLYPAFHFSIDLNTVTLKGPQKHTSTKQSSIPSFPSEGQPRPWMVALSTQTLTGCRSFITWWFEPERNRGSTKYQIASGSKLFGLVRTSHLPYHPSLPLCHSVSPPPLPVTVMAFSFKKVIAKAVKRTLFL